MLVIIGQVGLFLIEAAAQTGPDGSSLLAPYIIMAAFTILVLLPTAPIAHRFTFHIPTFLFLIFVGTLIYSLVAFPFSATNRYKAYFIQYVDLDTGENNVTISGLEDFVRPIIASIPTAAGHVIECVDRSNLRSGVRYCSYPGIAPNVVDNIPSGIPPEKGYNSWIEYNATRIPDQNSARLTIRGLNTRSCVLRFARPIKGFHVLGSGQDSRYDPVSEMGSDQIRLWHRNWDESWTVDVDWHVEEGKKPGEEGMEGTVVCLWNDGNVEGTIPALDEVRRFAPEWAAVTKMADGLVEGSKRFVV